MAYFTRRGSLAPLRAAERQRWLVALDVLGDAIAKEGARRRSRADEGVMVEEERDEE